MEEDNDESADFWDIKFCCSSSMSRDEKYPKGIPSKKLIELSGDSESTLKWTTMEQTLDYEGGIDTMAIPISNEVYKNLEELRQESLLCFNNPPPIEDHEFIDPIEDHEFIDPFKTTWDWSHIFESTKIFAFFSSLFLISFFICVCITFFMEFAFQLIGLKKYFTLPD